jgi:oxygen-dependent protoporphyrinogen oxidase
VTRPKIAVVGGGVSGLAAAFELSSGPDDTDVVLFEASDRLGGRIETTTFAGSTLDTGPDSFITRRPAAVELCEQLGLGGELIAPGAAGALVFARGALHRLPERTVLGVPTDLRALYESGVLSRRGLLRVAADLVLPGSRREAHDRDDPSVAEVLRPRIGSEAVSLLVDPLIGGINAGTSHNLSLRSVAPQIAEAAGNGRSIVKALRSPAGEPAPAPGGGAGPAASSIRGEAAPLFAGISGGLGRLVEALEGCLRSQNVRIELETGVATISRAGDRYELLHGSGAELADGVVLCLPAGASASLLGAIAPEAAGELKRVRYASVVLVTFAFGLISIPAAGTGILVPRPFRDVVTAVTFTSRKWPQSSPSDRVIVRASAGSVDDEQVAALGDDELTARVRGDLRRVAGIEADPTDLLVKRFPSSFAQYEPGHAARVARVRNSLAARPGLAIAGAACDGVGIPACIESGRRQAAAVLEAVAASGVRTQN